MVEKQAYKRGIPVIYVNPVCTSKRCSRCGSIGRRYRKRFACPHCGYITHADVNAALNIAAVSFCLPAPEGLFCAGNGQKQIPKKETRRFLRAGIPAGSPAQAVQGIGGGGKLPAVLE